MPMQLLGTDLSADVECKRLASRFIEREEPSGQLLVTEPSIIDVSG